MELHFKAIEKILRETLLIHFAENGYYYYHEYQNSYFRKRENGYLLQYTIFGTVAGSKFALSQQIVHQCVEDVLFEIGLPNVDLSTYNRKKDFLFTVNRNDIEGINFTTLKNEEDIQKFCEKVMRYMQNEGNAFINYYSKLPNILEQLNELIKEGKSWSQGEVKLGQSYFTGLIISKLCNDPEYNKKFEYVESLYFPPENKLTAYLPYLEKLKERLKTVEPIYNV